MSKSIEFAKVDGEFNREIFRFAMKIILLGPDFKDFKEKLAEKDRKAFEAAEKKLDADLMQLSESVDKGLKNNTLDKPQENGIIRKCIINITKTVGAIIGMAMGALGVIIVQENVKDPENIAIGAGLTV